MRYLPLVCPSSLSTRGSISFWYSVLCTGALLNVAAHTSTLACSDITCRHGQTCRASLTGTSRRGWSCGSGWAAIPSAGTCTRCTLNWASLPQARQPGRTARSRTWRRSDARCPPWWANFRWAFLLLLCGFSFVLFSMVGMRN